MSSGLHLGVTPWQAPGGGVAAELVRQARWAEQAGFDSFWLPESHFVKGARPAPLLELAAIAGATERIRIGTTSLLLPFRHPVLLAEELAVLDRLSSGRLIVGLGRGFRPALFSAFGIAASAKRDLFEKNLAGLLSAWASDVVEQEGVSRGAEAGAAVAYEVLPRPLQQPHPPLWVAAFGPRALQQAGRLGLPYLASPLETWSAIRSKIEQHRRCFFEHHGTDPELVPVMRTMFLSENTQTVAAVRHILTAERATWRTSSLGLGRTLSAHEKQQDNEQDVAEWAWVGDREQVAGAVAAAREQVGLSHLIVRSPLSAGTTWSIEDSLLAIVNALKG